MTQFSSYITGMTDYITRLNANATDAEGRLAAAEASLIEGGFNNAQLLTDLWDRHGAVGKLSGVPSLSGGNTQISITAGVAMITGRVAFTSQSVTGTGAAGARYAQVNSAGLLVLNTSIDAGAWLVATGTWNGAIFTALVDNRAILIDGDDYADALTSPLLGVFQGLSPRMDAAEAAAVSASIIDAKGDLLAGTADNVITRLPVGTNTQILIVDSTQATGLRWGHLDKTSRQFVGAQAAGTSGVGTSRGVLSGSSVPVISLPGTGATGGCGFTFDIPPDYQSGGLFRVRYTTEAGAANIETQNRLTVRADGGNIDSATETGLISVPVVQASSALATFTVTPITSTFTAGQIAVLAVDRDPTVAGDTFTGKLFIIGASFEYTRRAN